MRCEIPERTRDCTDGPPLPPSFTPTRQIFKPNPPDGAAANGPTDKSACSRLLLLSLVVP